MPRINKLSRVQQVAIGIFLLCSSYLVSCTKKELPANDSIVVALATSPNTLDPRYTTDANGMRLANLLFTSIVRLGPDLKIIGEAAESWSYKNKVYTFLLRPGLVFSNGRAVSAEDIEFSFAEYQSENSPFRSALSTIEKVEAKYNEKERVLKITLRDFSATLLTDLSPLKILPKKEVLAAGKDFSKSLVGSGSFQLTNQSSNEILLTANPYNTYSKPKTQKVLFKIIQDDNTRYLKTLKGAIDIAQAELPAGKIKELEEKKDTFSVYKYPGLSMTYLLINLKDPLLKDRLVREALSHAVNVAEIIQYKLEGLAEPASSILSPSSPFHNSALEAPKYDLELARKLIKDAGLSGKTLILKTSNTQSSIDHGKVIANQLSKIGIQVELQSFEWGTFYGDIKGGNYQLATMRWVGATDPDIYRIAFHSNEQPDGEKPGRNRGFYSNPRLDKLLDAGLKIENNEKRISLYNEVQAMVLKDLPTIPLWYDTQVSVVNRRVKDYQPPQNGDFSPLLSVSK
jgi:peptide/nickel transport system substrate-binding protein